ncbi:MAG: signal peptidase II [Alphaproteobacteria bacterium]|nr:signal peptidase II [Alphaproteobacteria bacterium]
MKKTFKIIAIISGILLVDQVTKGYMLYLLTGGIPLAGRAFDLVPHPYIMMRVTDFFNIVFTWNPGTSFSMFRSLGETAPLVLIIITGIIIGFFGHMLFFKTRDNLEKLGLSLIIGGAVGNLVDRVRFGAVIDFLDFYWKALHWPAFNIADICITVGVGLYIFAIILQKLRSR